MLEIKQIIGGNSVAAVSGKTSTGSTHSRARSDPRPASGIEDVRLAVAAAHSAFSAWSKTGPGERRALLLKAANRLASKADEFTRIMIEDAVPAHSRGSQWRRRSAKRTIRLFWRTHFHLKAKPSNRSRPIEECVQC
ncbi:aldehyde dehydrogenase family protein [Rhizobium lentis]|uniref:aldehyde dehydrogenase family protein n=1 Tax=Rhizobium lentis TaxID=1138194 RepID=UPI001C834DB9|nr:aldehyde dehydrogenase family protein [Rhizobium lentis]